MYIVEMIKKNKDLAFNGLFIVFIFIFSFPNFEPDFNVGLDGSFNWGYNYLWTYDYDTLKGLIYSYGPLGFLKKPVAISGGNTVLIAILFYSFIKLLFLYSLLFLGQKNHKIFSYFLVFTLAYFLNFDSILIGLSLLTAISFIKSKNILYYGILVLTCLISFYIKYTIGVACLSIILLCCSITVYEKWGRENLIKIVLITIGLLFTVSIAVGGNLFHFFDYVKNGFMVSKDYSSSLSLHPENNWFALIIFILTIVLYPFFRKKISYTYLLLIFPLFVVWKHSMVREDFSHYIQLLDFMVIFWGVIFLLDTTINKKAYILIPLISILAIHENAENITNYDGNYHKNIVGINKLNPYLFSFNDHTKSFYKISQEKIKVNKIENELRSIIGDQSIDIYPWDLSYVPANKFNWKPRKTFQSMGLSSWNDKQTSECYNQKNGPEYILFRNSKDSNNVELSSIDFSYLLNQDPLTSNQVLTNYNILHTNKKYTLFKKNNTPNFKKIKMKESSFIDWNTWIECPKAKGEFLKTNVKIEKTFVGNILQLLYKDAAYHIDYLLVSGKILTYRFIPSNAENGIWVNPFVRSFRKEVPHEQVSKIRLRTGTGIGVKDNFLLNWVTYKKMYPRDSTLFHYSSFLDE